MVGEEVMVPPVLNDHCSLPSSCAATLVLLAVMPPRTPAATAVVCSTRRRVRLPRDLSTVFIPLLFII